MRRMRWTRMAAVLAMFTMVATACPQQEAEQEPADELVLGYILPQTGSLAFLGPPMIAGVQMAVQEIQGAGGPLGRPLRLLEGDEAGEAELASQAADRMAGEGVHAIVGAAASGMTRAIIDQLTGAGIVQCSPSNTSAEFTDWNDDGYYFRTAPPDGLQAQVLSELILSENRERVAILARADGYGRGLADSTAENLRDGGAEVVLNSTYDVNATTFDAEVEEVRAVNPDAVVLVTFEEGVQLIQGLLEAEFQPNQMYGVDGNRSEQLNASVDPTNPNVLDGFKGTSPTPDAVEGFLERFRQENPDATETIYAPQAYDCVMLIALAAVAAGEITPRGIRDNIVDLTTGDNECTGFQQCADLLADDQSISYQFASGTQSFSDAGEPSDGLYEIWEWQAGALAQVRTQTVES